MRALFQFGKLNRLRFVSHLDLQRFMQMALRRTDLPVAYSQGFNPHPHMAFASALAVNWTSQAEILDVRLAEPVEKQRAFEQMRRALPPDLPLYQVRLVDDRHPAMMAQLRMADYRILLDGEGADAIAGAINGFLQENEVVALRKTKSGEKPTDIRPMALMLFEAPSEAGVELRARLMLTERATLKPDLLLSVLASRAGAELPPPERVRIHRLALLGEDARGKAVSLMDL